MEQPQENEYRVRKVNFQNDFKTIVQGLFWRRLLFLDLRVTLK